MPAPPVHHVDVRAFRYATEVPERVEAALAAVFPAFAEADGPSLDRSSAEGHYGHQIDVYEARLSRADEVRTVFDRLGRGGALDHVLAELDARVTDDCDLFLRLDKQRAYTDNTLVPGRGIEMRLRIEAYPAKREAAIENIRAYLEEFDAG